MVHRRVAGLPIQHIVGWAEFCGHRVQVDPGVFIPRPRTEFLATRAVALADQVARPVVVDLCCGSGAVGVAVAAGVPAVDLHASDLDRAAVACARRNLAGVGTVYQGDLFEALPADLRGHVDVLVVNVPYVPTAAIELMPREARVFEPALALDGGRDGLDVLRRVAAGAAEWLAPGGHLLVETGADQAAAAADAFSAGGLCPSLEFDIKLDATIVVGGRPAGGS